MLSRDNRRAKTILTTEGKLRFKRYLLRPSDAESRRILEEKYHTKSIAPLDEYLGLVHLPFKVTCDMALKLTKIAITESSYKDAQRRMQDDFGITISDDLIHEIVNYVGEIVVQEEQRITQDVVAVYDPSQIAAGRRVGRPPNNALTLYLEMDGAMFNTRGKNKEGSSWRENKLGLAFRSDELIKITGENGHIDYRIGEREYICCTAGVDEFRARLLALAVRNGLMDAYQVVILSDGATWIRKTKESLFPFAIQILDLCHLKENVSKFAQCVFKNDKTRYVPWSKDVCDLLEAGKWRMVLKLKEVAIYESQDTPAGIVNLYHYIWNNQDIINYPAYKSKGYFVGSGAIESGNKTVMQERLKLAGMRWQIPEAQRILSLRSKLLSNQWDSFVVPLVRQYYRKGNIFHPFS